MPTPNTMEMESEKRREIISSIFPFLFHTHFMDRETRKGMKGVKTDQIKDGMKNDEPME